MDKIKLLVEKISGIYLDASSLENTWFLLSAPSWKALKKSTLDPSITHVLFQ
jgi:hypothetical protein